jgi:hypothetical protein
MRLLRSVAWRSFLNGSDAIDYESATMVIREELRIPYSEVESTTRDFLNRSFLTRVRDKYRFAHKSLAEYLFAEEAHRWIRGNNLSFLETAPRTGAACGMVIELFEEHTDIARLAERMKVGRDDVIVEWDQLHAMSFLLYGIADLLDPSGSGQSELVEKVRATKPNPYCDDSVSLLEHVVIAREYITSSGRGYPARSPVVAGEVWKRVLRRCRVGHLAAALKPKPEDEETCSGDESKEVPST